MIPPWQEKVGTMVAKSELFNDENNGILLGH